MHQVRSGLVFQVKERVNAQVSINLKLYQQPLISNVCFLPSV